MFKMKRHLPALFALVLLIWLLKPISDSIIFGAIIAYIMLPLHKKLSIKMGNSRSAILMSALAFTLIVLPAIYLYGFVLQQGLVAYDNLSVLGLPSEGFIPREIVEKQEFLLTKPSENFGEFIASYLLLAPELVLKLFLLVFIIGYLLKDHGKLHDYINRLRLTGQEQEFILRFSEGFKAIIYINFMLALIFGFLSGILLTLLRVPYAAPIATLVTFFTFLPVMGYWVILAAVAIWQYTIPNLVNFGILVAFIVVVGVVEILFRASLSEYALNPILFAFGFFGGVMTFGLPGIFIGPLLMCAIKSAFDISTQKPGKQKPEKRN